jgi:hypothetical protein
MSASGKRKFAFISALILTCATATAAAFFNWTKQIKIHSFVPFVGAQFAPKEVNEIFCYFREGYNQTNVNPKFNSDDNASRMSRIDWLFDLTKTSMKEFWYHLRTTKTVFGILDDNLDEWTSPSLAKFVPKGHFDCQRYHCDLSPLLRA